MKKTEQNLLLAIADLLLEDLSDPISCSSKRTAVRNASVKLRQEQKAEDLDKEYMRKWKSQ